MGTCEQLAEYGKMVRGDEKCVETATWQIWSIVLGLIAGYVQSSPAAFERTVKYLVYTAGRKAPEVGANTGMGDNTPGTGMVQQPFPLSGVLFRKITERQFTWGGRDINGESNGSVSPQVGESIVCG